MITRIAWHTFNIGKFSPSELPQLALQLEACEGAGHLPEPDVPSARGGQLALHLGGEGHTVDVLRKGFRPQDNGLLPPFPHSQHVVWAAPHRCKEIAVVGLEVHVAVGLLCSLSQQAVELEVGGSCRWQCWAWSPSLPQQSIGGLGGPGEGGGKEEGREGGGEGKKGGKEEEEEGRRGGVEEGREGGGEEERRGGVEERRGKKGTRFMRTHIRSSTVLA